MLFNSTRAIPNVGRVPPMTLPRSGRTNSSPLAATRAAPFPWIPEALLLALLLPTSTSFMIGPLRVSPYRVILLFAFVPLVLRLFGGRHGRFSTVDILMLFQALWAIIALTINHDLSVGLQSGGIYLVETFGAYLVGRMLLRTPESIASLFRMAWWCLLLLLPLVVVESWSGLNLPQKLFAPDGSFSPEIGSRLGFYRAFGPMDHPILWGVFAASFLAPTWYANHGRRNVATLYRIARSAVPAVAAMTSVSSGAFTVLVLQVALIIWEQLTHSLKHRWWMLLALLTSLYLLVDIISNRSALRVFISYLTFSPETAYFRIIIWEWGTQYNVYQSPLFGIGQNDWVRPDWMHSTSMDNFWLVSAVMFGLPTALSLLAVSILTVFHPLTVDNAVVSLRYKYALLFTLISLMIAAATVHFWNAMLVWLALLLGVAATRTQLDTQES